LEQALTNTPAGGNPGNHSTSTRALHHALNPMSSTEPNSYYKDWSNEQLLELFELRVKIKQHNIMLGFPNNNAELENCRSELLRRMAVASPKTPPHDAPPASPAQQGEPGTGGNSRCPEPGPGSFVPQQRRLMQDAVRRLPELWARVFR
jgi:hypothetical protein